MIVTEASRLPRAGRRRWAALAWAAAVLVSGQVAVQAVWQAPASALPGAVVESGQTPFDLVPVKTARALCPPGTRVTGGSGRVNGGAGRVVLTGMRPVQTAGQDRYEVTAAVGEAGALGTWSVQAFAICANVPGLQIVSAGVADGGQRFVEASAQCPPGPRLRLGGGALITGGQGQVALASVNQPLTGLQEGIRAAAAEDVTGFGGAWSLTSFAICAPTDQRANNRRQVGPFDSTSPKIITVQCPFGNRVTSGGAELLDISVFPSPIIIESIAPEVLPGGSPGTTVRVVARESAPTNDDWTVIAHAICAP